MGVVITVAVVEEAAVEAIIRQTRPTTIKMLRIKIRIKALLQKVIRKAQNTQISLPVLAGPVLSTGRKAEVLLTVPIH